MKTGLNVGSGQRPFTSTPEVKWVNIDKIAHDGMPHPDLLCDGAGLPYSTASIDYFVLSQVYEHFGCGEALNLLQEAYRVLKVNGSLIISVPNMRALAGRWLGGELDTQIYMTNVYGAYMGHEEDRHKWGSAPETLASDIAKIGEWQVIKWFDGRPIPGLDVAMDWWITCLEARR